MPPSGGPAAGWQQHGRDAMAARSSPSLCISFPHACLVPLLFGVTTTPSPPPGPQPSPSYSSAVATPLPLPSYHATLVCGLQGKWPHALATTADVDRHQYHFTQVSPKEGLKILIEDDYGEQAHISSSIVYEEVFSIFRSTDFVSIYDVHADSRIKYALLEDVTAESHQWIVKGTAMEGQVLESRLRGVMLCFHENHLYYIQDFDVNNQLYNYGPIDHAYLMGFTMHTSMRFIWYRQRSHFMHVT
ncbi:hypothetical protein ACP4OV_002937 [Aristida adscensionis]